MNDDIVTPKTKVYVSPNLVVYKGKNAEKFVNLKNDLKYLTKDGIIRVPKKRWEIAQKYEKNTWMCRALNANDDRNEEHAQRFSNYKQLSNYNFENVIELGCGPFTNLRYIIQNIQIPKQIDLLDPLINDYLNHPNCSYSNGRLMGIPINTIPSTIEDFKPQYKYNLIILINVLRHCYDIKKVFNVLLTCMAELCILVFAEDFYNENDVKAIAKNQFDSGHPLRITNKYIYRFLNNNLDFLYKKEYIGLHKQAHRIDLYFIGKKK